MAVSRRVGSESSETRSELLDVAERLMLEEGYAAVGSRRIAKKAGVTAALIYYYFPTLDDLFLALLRRRGDEQLERLARTMASDRPLHALWELSSNPAGAAFITEFMALANHRKSIRSELAEYGRRYLEVQHYALSAAERDGRVDLTDVPTRGLLVLILHMSHGLLMDRSVGWTWGHDEAYELVERYLNMGDGRNPRQRTDRTRRASPKR